MVGDNIKRYRCAKNMTQDEIAEKLNVTRQAVSNWENGKTQPDIEMLDRLAIVLDVSIEELIYGEQRKVVPIVKNWVITKGTKTGVSFGAVLAIVISYVKWHSIGWAIFHGLLNWVYVIYYVIKYGFNG